MKRGTKGMLRVAGAAFGLGMLLWLTGLAMGGRSASLQALPALDLGGFSAGPSGIHIGGKNGLHVTSDGIDIGGEHGLHVGSGGIYVGDSGGKDIATPGDLQVVEETELDSFDRIEIDLDLGDIWLQEGGEPSVSMRWDLDSYTISCRVEGGVLKIGDQSERHLINMGGSYSAKVIVTLTEGMELDRIDAGTDLGDIHVDAGIAAKEVSLETDLGDVSCIGLTAERLEARTDLGDVDITFPRREGVGYTLKTDLGEVRVEGKGQGGSSSHGAANERYFIQGESALGDVSLRFAE